VVTVPTDAPAWAHALADDVAAERRRVQGSPAALARFSKTDLPDPARWAYTWIIVTDATGGPIPAFSDGVSWCTPSNTIIS
jgi:hypothetical protein